MSRSTKKDSQLSEILKKIDSLSQIIEFNQSYLEEINTLLGRFVFPNDQLVDIIRKYKKDPEKYVIAYNLFNGELNQTKIAEMSKIDQGQLSRVLEDWKEMGIIYEISKKGGKFFKKLYKVEPKKGKRVQSEETTEETQQASEGPSQIAEAKKEEELIFQYFFTLFSKFI
jgi:DNA-binding MarR family transcriptional regulator